MQVGGEILVLQGGSIWYIYASYLHIFWNVHHTFTRRPAFAYHCYVTSKITFPLEEKVHKFIAIMMRPIAQLNRGLIHFYPFVLSRCYFRAVKLEVRWRSYLLFTVVETPVAHEAAKCPSLTYCVEATILSREVHCVEIRPSDLLMGDKESKTRRTN